MLFITNYMLFITNYMLFIPNYMLLITNYMLFITNYMLFITNFPRIGFFCKKTQVFVKIDDSTVPTLIGDISKTVRRRALKLWRRTRNGKLGFLPVFRRLLLERGLTPALKQKCTCLVLIKNA